MAECEIDGCVGLVQSAGLCKVHYRRKRQNKPMDAPIRRNARPAPRCSYCERAAVAQGLCSTHDRRRRKGLDLEAPVKTPGLTPTCVVDGCGGKHLALGYCNMHYNRLKKGQPLEGPPLKLVVREKAPKKKCLHCERVASYSGPLCSLHYRRKLRGIAPDAPLRTAPDKGQCTIASCTSPAKVKGMCELHYHRAREGREMNPAPKPAKYVGPHGYVYITGGKKGGAKVLEHRVVMEQIIGRPLLRHENVHHINGDRADNRPSNLEIWNTSQPSGQRVPDKVAWAIELLELYAPETLSGRGAQLRLLGREEGAA